MFTVAIFSTIGLTGFGVETYLPQSQKGLKATSFLIGLSSFACMALGL